MNIFKIIILLLFISVIVGGIIYLYFFYEKPMQEILLSNYKNISISAKNNNEFVVINYEIYVNNTFYREGKTQDRGAILERIPFNNTFQILGYDKNNNYYGHLTEEYFTNSKDIQRIELLPRKIGKLNIVDFGVFGLDRNITLVISSNGNVENLFVCLRWSFNILDAKLEQYEQISPRGLYKNYDRCYDTKISIKNSKQTLILNYELFKELNENDYINVSFIDKDIRKDGYISEENNEDIGMKDKTINLKI